MRLGFACKVIGMQHDSYKVYRRQPALGGGGRADRQKGLSLFVVLVIVLLSTLLAAWAFRSSIFNQLVVSNDADYQRAFEAAQATLQDAEFDVQNIRPDGTPCQRGNDTKICRHNSSSVYFPTETKDFNRLVSSLEADQKTKCQFGICQKRAGAQDFWNLKETLDDMLAQAAKYGEYTGATKTGPILDPKSGSNAGAWYWVEVLPYQTAGQVLMSNHNPRANKYVYAPETSLPFVYRITVLARGMRPGTQVILQSVLVRQRLN